jgi:hypothetical protein
MMQRILNGELPYVALIRNVWCKSGYGYIQVRLEWRWGYSPAFLDQRIPSWNVPAYDDIPF